MNEIYGSCPGEVIALLDRRRRLGYRPGVSDGNRVGLIVEGGSMRGVISSAALDALHRLGYGNCFDEVWGTSSGAINAAYFVSGQTSLGTAIYYEIATDPAFISIWKWPNILDIDWLIDRLIASGKMLDIEAIMQSKTDLYVSATEIDTGVAAFFSNRDGRPEIIVPALRASVCAPLFTDRTEQIDAHSYNDGMVQAGLPVAAAAARCTHLVAALTREMGYRKRKSSMFSFYERFRLRGYSRAYRHNYRVRHIAYNNALETLFSGQNGPHSLVIAPATRQEVIGNSDTRVASLKQAIWASRMRVQAIFSAECGVTEMPGE